MWKKMFFIIVISFCYSCSGCISTKRLDDNVGREAIYTVGQLKAELDYTERRVAEITNRADSLEGDINLFTEQFREYVRLVQQLRTRLVEYEQRVATEEKTVD